MLCVCVCLSHRKQNYATSFQAIFIKLCVIMDYCYGKNRLNLGVDLAQNGRMVAIFDCCYNILHATILSVFARWRLRIAYDRYMLYAIWRCHMANVGENK